ncbi:MAG: TlpA disulfide reductase family protein, partial [Gammaproteobacteria bacterium]|nr:TlpA disulfide reductase family protein [Gammaproteobacteria bacterium]
MKKPLCFIAMISAVVLCVAISTDQSKTYTITGHVFESKTVNDPALQRPDDKETSAEEHRLDLSTVTVSIRKRDENNVDEMSFVEMASGKFVDGTVSFQGSLEETSEIEITINVDGEDELTVDALIEPGAQISFALIDLLGPEPDRMLLFGASNRAKDIAKKFTVSGQLDLIAEHGALAVVEVNGRLWNEDGELSPTNYGSVLVRDGSFIIEAEIDEPTSIDISVNLLSETSALAHIYGVAVVEPKSVVEVSTRGTSTDLITKSESHLHRMLVETWQKNEEYQAKMDRGQILQSEFLAKWRAGQEPTENEVETVEEDLAPEIASNESEDSTELETPKESGIDDGMLRAAGCEHVELVEKKLSVSDFFEPPEFRVLWDEAWQIRVDTLEEIALESDDPWMTLLALDLGAFNFYFGDRDHAMRVHDELGSKLAPDVVSRRLKPKRDLLARLLERERVAKGVLPGQKAPLFSLPDLQGEEIALTDLLETRDLVYIDFWASWCGPCIESFPKLKSLYDTFESHGFEIVVISLDESFDDWKDASLEQEFSWLNVADIGGFEQETPRAYGVQYIPIGFLVDSKGCIIRKELPTNMLERVLTQRYDDSSSSNDSNLDVLDVT